MTIAMTISAHGTNSSSFDFRFARGLEGAFFIGKGCCGNGQALPERIPAAALY